MLKSNNYTHQLGLFHGLAEQKSISTENTFQNNTIDIDFLNGVLSRMTEKIAFELRSQNQITDCITVKLRYSDFETHTVQRSIDYTNADHTLLTTAKELFKQLYDRRLLVRLVGIRFTNLIPGTYQINLFEDTPEMINLYQAVDSVKTRFGEKLLMKAGGLR